MIGLDFLAWFIRRTPYFKGKWRLTDFVMRHRPKDVVRRRPLGGGVIECRLGVPYEAMVWMRQEEEGELNALRRLLRPGDVFVDCGANIGLWTLVAAEAVGLSGRVVAFEPSPTTFSRLQRHTGDALPQACLHNVAVGRDRSTVFLLCPEEHNLARLVSEGVSGAFGVPCVPLNEVVVGTVHGIKLDVEGAELAALEGASDVIERDKPWLIIEFNTIHAGINRLADWPVHKHLFGLGYSPRLLGGEHPLSAPRLPDSWECRGYRNLLYTHG